MPLADSSSAQPGRPTTRALIFSVLSAASLVIFFGPLSALFQTAFHEDEYTHILLVLPVSLALIYLEGRNLKLRPTYSPRLGAALLLASLALLAAAHFGNAVITADEIRLSLIFALVVFWLGSVIGCCGTRIFKALLFPFLFLFAMVPLPALWLDKVVVFLQQASTDATFALFKLSATPVMKDGFVLSLPSLQIEVARQCSGIRSSEMLFITGLILAHLFLRKFWTKLAFVLFIIPMAVIKNAIRIFTLAMLGIHVNPDFLEGRLHHEGGGVFFALALGLLLGVLWALQKLENRVSGSKPTPAPLEVATKSA